MLALAVVGVIFPGDDVDAETLAGDPSGPIQDVVLQQTGRAVHGGLIAADSHASY